ncbi:MAG: pitrilysin family protein [Pseudomonadota bacterium]
MRLIWVLFAALVPSTVLAVEIPVSTTTLENGMDVVVIEDNRAPIVTHMVWYRVGSADEPSGKTGIAHYLEHLMFKGTETRGVGEFSDIIAANGGTENAFTSFDYTGYFQRIAADRLELMIALESDRMVNLVIPDSEYAPELGVVLAERNQRTDSNPGALLNEQRRAVQFVNHPYGNPIVGWRAEIEGLSPDDVMAFYEAHYAPNNAILVVAGDVEPNRVFELAEQYYGAIPANPAITPRARPPEPPRLAEARLSYSDPRFTQPYLIRTYPAPVREAGNQRDAAVATMLAEVLAGSGVTSVFGDKLVLNDGIAVGASAWHWDTSYDPQVFGLYAAPKPGISLEDMEAAMDTAIAEFIEEGVDAAQLERIKAQIRASEVYARDSQNGLARTFGEALAVGLTVEDVLAWPDILQDVSGEEIIDMAERLFDPTKSVTSYAMPPEVN